MGDTEDKKYLKIWACEKPVMTSSLADTYHITLYGVLNLDVSVYSFQRVTLVTRYAEDGIQEIIEVAYTLMIKIKVCFLILSSSKTLTLHPILAGYISAYSTFDIEFTYSS